MIYAPPSLAVKYLQGLSVIEIGGAAHCPAGVPTINADQFPPSPDSPYSIEQRRHCGAVRQVDVVCPANNLPFDDGTFGGLYSGHVLEHLVDPVRALVEWWRVARDVVVLLLPDQRRCPMDRGRPLTTTAELLGRYHGTAPLPQIVPFQCIHTNVWTMGTFVDLLAALRVKIVDTQDVDDTGRGDGFVVVADGRVKPQVNCVLTQMLETG